MRLRNNPNAKRKLYESDITLKDFPIILKKNTIIEIGMGKGEMLTQLANANPQIEFIGIEKFATVAYKALKKAEDLKLNNFSIVLDDIVNIPKIFSGKTGTIWLTFSDPWPKLRHEKRRLTHRKFLSLYQTILTKNGVIKFKTDNDKLFNYSVLHMKEYGLKLSNITRDFHNHKASQGNFMTGYEKKWSSEGKNINYLEARYK